MRLAGEEEWEEHKDGEGKGGRERGCCWRRKNVLERIALIFRVPPPSRSLAGVAH